jgi:NTP pyrophosphatase (non-canonical NTP hydrolase)
VTETITHSFKEQYGIHTEFIEWLMAQQIIFEQTRKGTDGSLWEKNTIEYGLTRGVIGEAEEALEDLRTLYELYILTPDAEELIKQTHDHLKTELIDILIFLSSVFVHAGMSPEDVIRIAAEKMERNHAKYTRANFVGKPVAEGIQYSRDKAAGSLPEQRIEYRRRNGHPRPGNDPMSRETDQYDYLASGAGTLS